MGIRDPRLVDRSPGIVLNNKLPDCDKILTGFDKINKPDLQILTRDIDCSDVLPDFQNSFINKWNRYNKIRSRIFNDFEPPTINKTLSSRILKTRQRHKDLKSEYKLIVSSIIGPGRKDSRPYAQVELWGNALSGLLDSGSEITVLGSGSVEFLRENDIEFRSLKASVSVANGSPSQIIGRTQTKITYKGETKDITIYIAPGLTQSLYLGYDFFELFGLDKFLVSEISTPNLNADTNAHELNTKQLRMVENVKQLFPSFSKLGLGKTHLIEHHIDTGNATPIKKRHYPISPAKEALLYEELDRMLKLGVIEESKSPWSSPVATVVKPGKTRVCLDSRDLNKVTVKDAYPIPHIEGLLMRLSDTFFISAIDLKDAFWQIPLSKASREKTAFTVAGRPLYQYTVMPFGLCNSPQTMMRLMDLVIPAELKERVFVYLDDLLVFSRSFEEHLVLLERVAKCIRLSGLTINLEKSRFCMKQVNYLGFLIGNGVIQTTDEKVSAIKSFSIPKTPKEVRRFLGLANYYRKFVKDFSTLSAPLSDLLKKNKKFEMTDSALKSLEQLKEALCSAPVLVHPNYSKPFIVQCDASSTGIGAVLCQLDDEGVERPIYYHSQKLNKAQRNYSVTELECLAAVSAVKKFRPYIEMLPFKIITDHASLRWLMGQRDLSGRLARWSLSLAAYDFEIEHRKGSEHVVPDTLSRAFAEELASIQLCVVEVDLEAPEFDDEDYKDLRTNVQENSEALPGVKIEGKFVYKKTEFSTGDDEGDTLSWKLWIPTGLTESLIRSAHDPPQASHGGISKTLSRLRQNYYWPQMASQVRKFITSCEVCKSTKAPNFVTRPPMGSQSVVEKPFQKLYVDLLGPYPRSKMGNSFILVCLDHFSKFVFVEPLRKADSTSIIKFLEKQVFSIFGVPESLHSDNGRQFISKEMKEFCERYAVRQIFTGVYAPQSNASERVNRSIVAAIRSYINGDHSTWDDQLHSIALSLRSSVHSAIKMSPFYALFGRQMVIHGSSYPILHKLNAVNDGEIEILSKPDTMKLIDESVVRNLKKAYDKGAKTYNLRTRKVVYVPGQEIYRRNFQLSDFSKAFNAKLAPKYMKARIHSKIGNNLYQLEDLKGKILGVFHAKDLRP